MSTVLGPLYKLQQERPQRHWTAKEQAAFRASKYHLTSTNLLALFNSDLYHCDASAHGIDWAILDHRMPDGPERPIGYASRTCQQPNEIMLRSRGNWHVFLEWKDFAHIYSDFLFWVHYRSSTTPCYHETNTAVFSDFSINLSLVIVIALNKHTISFQKTGVHGNPDVL